MNEERPTPGWTTSRRQLLKAGLGTAAAGIPVAGALAGPAAARGRDPQQRELITRPLPDSNERVPVIGLGTFMTFDTLPGQRRDHIRRIIRRHWDAGGRVFDVSPLYGASEANLGEVARSFGIHNRMFLMNKLWSTGEYLWDDSHAESVLERSLERLHRSRPIDVMQCHNVVNVDVNVQILRAWKNEGRVRYIAITHHDSHYHDVIASFIERGLLDFVQIRYSIFSRAVEERILPAAAERGVGVIVHMALEKARLHAIVEGRPLPDFAVAFGIKSWAEFFLKWVIAHPAVTCVLPATSNPEHVLENVTAMRGPLPGPAMREEMRAYMETIEGFDRIDQTPWYPGKSYSGLVAKAQSELLARQP